VLREPQRSRSEHQTEGQRPTGADVNITVHPALPPAIAMGMFVSAADQAYIDAMRLHSYELAIARGHVRR
jgi:hypothetical protein